MNFSDHEIQTALKTVRGQIPSQIPGALAAACKIDQVTAELDPAWPIKSNREALEVLMTWNLLTGAPVSVAEEVFRLTHSHACELIDLEKYGYEEVYIKSWSTKYISISWHLAGRYDYDKELLGLCDSLQGQRLLDFGAAPWVESILYARKGLKVTAVNQSKESECNHFGRFLAQFVGCPHIDELSSDEPFPEQDIIYAVDVLEHIPPEKDGTPGWVRFAEKLNSCLRPGGIWYVNAPLDADEGTPHPVSYHPVHFTSPMKLQDWEAEHGIPNEGKYFIKHKVG